jgi:hypothetical protein
MECERAFMSVPTFWRLMEPEYDSDYRDTFINGKLEHPFSLPGVKCESCGATWGGSRILPVPCPDEVQNRKELKERWPVSGREHRVLRDEVASALRERGYSGEDLSPGDCFQPSFLDVPSKPRADFLWASLGSVAVSARIKRLFEDAGYRGAEFCPIILRKVGKREARLPPPIPSTGEPEDMYAETELVKLANDIDPYFEMLITAESGKPAGAETASKCDLCGREEYERRILAMRPEMWRGEDVFHLATTLWIVITGKVRDALRQLRPTNVMIQRL